MKKIFIALITIIIALAFVGCALFGIKIDTSSWVNHQLGDTGITIMLPEDMAETDGEGQGIALANEEIRMNLAWTDDIYPDIETLDAHVGQSDEIITEIVMVNDAELVLIADGGEGKKAEYYGIGAKGDTFRLLLETVEDADEKHAKAVLAKIAETICVTPEETSNQTTEDEFKAPTSSTDPMVLVNERIDLPSNWAKGLTLVNLPNSRDEMLQVDLTAGRAFIKLKHALHEEGIDVEAGACYDKSGLDHPEHETGLALDMYLLKDGEEATGKNKAEWAKAQEKLAEYGFILRYPKGGEYYTGCEYMPQHIRYVGKKVAKKIYKKGITLEEYLGKDPASIDYLLLVNKEHAMPEGWEDKIQLTYMVNNVGDKIGVERITYEAYLKLKEALLKDGVHTDINTAYRSVQDQIDLAAEFTVKYGPEYVENYVAVPGYSEHHTGLAIDLYLESVDAWAKIAARLPEFGFILRYPLGKEDITGYSYEPWHIRYVGKDAAKEIAKKNLALEEYVG